MKRIRICSLLLVTVLVCLLGISAAASDEHAAMQPDYSKTGSISVTIQTVDKTPVSGGNLTFYEVAKAVVDNGDNFFVPTKAFADADVDLTNLESAGLAETLTDYAAGAEGITVSIGSDGTAKLSGLELGLYLLVQETPAEGYEAILPFLVTVPLWDGEALIYDVDATPKPVVAIANGKVALSVEKKIEEKAGKAPKDTVFQFTLTPKAKGYPMPAGEVNQDGAVTVSITGSGTADFGTISYDSSNAGKTYTYTVAEVKGDVKNYTYDETVYEAHVQVSYKDGKVTATLVCTDASGKTVDTMAFTNVYEEEPESIPSVSPLPSPTPTPSETLPNTGLLWWPVMLLAALGVLFVAAGLTCRRRKSR